MGRFLNWWLAWKLGQFAWERRPSGRVPQWTTPFELLLRRWFGKAVLAFMLWFVAMIIAGAIS